MTKFQILSGDQVPEHHSTDQIKNGLLKESFELLEKDKISPFYLVLREFISVYLVKYMYDYNLIPLWLKKLRKSTNQYKIFYQQNCAFSDYELWDIPRIMCQRVQSKEDNKYVYEYLTSIWIEMCYIRMSLESWIDGF